MGRGARRQTLSRKRNRWKERPWTPQNRLSRLQRRRKARTNFVGRILREIRCPEPCTCLPGENCRGTKEQFQQTCQPRNRAGKGNKRPRLQPLEDRRQ